MRRFAAIAPALRLTTAVAAAALTPRTIRWANGKITSIGAMRTNGSPTPARAMRAFGTPSRKRLDGPG